MKFLVPNYSCLQNPWLGGYRPPDPRSLYPLSSTEFVEPLPPPKKIPGYATDHNMGAKPGDIAKSKWRGSAEKLTGTWSLLKELNVPRCLLLCSPLWRHRAFVLSPRTVSFWENKATLIYLVRQSVLFLPGGLLLFLLETVIWLVWARWIQVVILTFYFFRINFNIFFP